MKNFNKKGFILVEVIIAIAVFVVFSSSMVSMILGGFNILQKGADYSYAAELNQEAIEAVKSIKKRAWNELQYNESAIYFDKEWKLAGEGSREGIEKFDRYVEFYPVFRNSESYIQPLDSGEKDYNSLRVKSVVSWQENKKDLSLEVETFLSNWESSVWGQYSWAGGDGQFIFSDKDMFFNSSNIDFSSGLKLEKISTSSYAQLGFLESSIFGPVENGVFSVLQGEGDTPSNCPECSIGVQIKTAEDVSGAPANWSETWCGPEGEDGDENDYFDVLGGSFISVDHNGDRWIKYKVVFEGDGNATPHLNDIKIFYK